MSYGEARRDSARVWVVTIEPYHENSIVVIACATEGLANDYVRTHGKRMKKGDIIYYIDKSGDGQFDITKVPLEGMHQ